MNKSILTQFADVILMDKLEAARYTRKKNSWYKIIPDVILCVELRKLRYSAFDIVFGIVPFACFSEFRWNIGCFQPEVLYSQTHAQRLIDKYGLARNWRQDSTIHALKDPNSYPIYAELWTGVFDEIIEPCISSVHDLASACKSIGGYLGTIHSKEHHYYPSHAPMFMKLGMVSEAMHCLDSFMECREELINSSENYIEKEAEMAWREGRLANPFLYYWLCQTDDAERMAEIVRNNEEAAQKWIEMQGL